MARRGWRFEPPPTVAAAVVALRAVVAVGATGAAQSASTAAAITMKATVETICLQLNL
jgi:hypothetical protein